MQKTTAIFIQRFGPDAFFSQAQQDRKEELLARRGTLTSQEHQELEHLVLEELEATVKRRPFPSTSGGVDTAFSFR